MVAERYTAAFMVDSNAQIAECRQLSPWFDHQLGRHPQWAEQLGDTEAAPSPDEPGFPEQLRHWRNRQQLRHIMADLVDGQAVAAGLNALSDTADAAIQAALNHHLPRLQEIHGTPRNAEGEPQGLAVVAMGKLGGRELNFSSDVDLIYLYGEPGGTDGRRRLENQRFFTLLAQAINGTLSERTEAGFVYRVDTRLRPFGSAGALVQNLGALETYFQREGRDWERYAWIKARGVAGDSDTAAEALAIARPFVYRRYVDYGVLQALRSMHASVLQQARARDQLDDLKRGTGGIRSLEFLVQSQQLLKGGREPSLQVPGFLEALTALVDTRDLSSGLAESLSADYLALRQLENRIQALHDRQTHRLPDNPDDRERILDQYGRENWDDFCSELDQLRARVSNQFNAIAAEPSESIQREDGQHQQLWQQLSSDRPVDEHSLDHPAWQALSTDVRSGLLEWLPRFDRLPLSARGQRRMDQLMPRMLALLEETQASAEAAHRLWQLLQKISRRSAYLVLLAENPGACRRLLKLLSVSGHLAGQVIQYPALLDELIDPALNRQLPAAEETSAMVERQVLKESDPEKALERLAYLRLSHEFRTGIAVLEDTVPARLLNRSLTHMARLCVRACLDLSARDRKTVPLAVIAYGALGAGDMHFASDLDLVFLHADGADPQLARRHVQRFNSLLATPTGSGKLFSVDSRLRPNGPSGLLVSSMTAYRRYQNQQAWQWERQALTRARWVAGGSGNDMKTDFQAIRRQVLAKPVPEDALVSDLVAMRQKMRQERPADERVEVLKQLPAGILDLQFLTQAGLLICAPDHPAVSASSQWHDQLDALESVGWISPQQAEVCRQNYDEAQWCLLQLGTGMAVTMPATDPDLVDFLNERLPGLLA